MFAGVGFAADNRNFLLYRRSIVRLAILEKIKIIGVRYEQ